MSLQIIEADRPDELDAVYRLRYEVLRKAWGQPPGTERDETEGESLSFLALVAGIPAGTARLHFNSPQQAQVRYMAVMDQYQGQGIGRALLEKCEEVAKQQGATEMMLNARQNAIPFYETCGYKIVADSYLLWGQIPHKQMVKPL